MEALRSLLRPRRLLLAAFAISLLLHLVLATRLDWPFAPPPERVEAIRMEHVHAIRIAKLPTPPPNTPPPVTPSPQPSASPAAKPKRAHNASPGRGRRAVVPQRAGAPPTPAVTPVPTPRPSPTASCGGGDTPAAVASAPPYPQIASGARGSATNGTTQVKVMLDAAGAVQSAAVARSSGNGSLDVVALSMAKDAVYTPATHLCKPVASAYLFTVKFVAW